MRREEAGLVRKDARWRRLVRQLVYIAGHVWLRHQTIAGEHVPQQCWPSHHAGERHVFVCRVLFVRGGTHA